METGEARRLQLDQDIGLGTSAGWCESPRVQLWLHPCPKSSAQQGTLGADRRTIAGPARLSRPGGAAPPTLHAPLLIFRATPLFFSVTVSMAQRHMRVM